MPISSGEVKCVEERRETEEVRRGRAGRAMSWLVKGDEMCCASVVWAMLEVAWGSSETARELAGWLCTSGMSLQTVAENRGASGRVYRCSLARD